MTSLPLTPLLDHRKWLVGVLLVALVPFFTACPPDRPEDPDIFDPDTEMPVTSVAALMAPDAERLEGRDVQLMNVRIVEVVGDTAFYVTDDMPPAPGVADPEMDPAPPPTAPGATPGQPTPGVEDRVIVRYDTGLLNDVAAPDRDADLIRVGERVNVFGEVRTWNGVRRDPVTPRPTPMDNDVVTEDPPQPDAAPAQPRAPMDERVFVDAHRVEPAGAAPAPGAPGTRGQPGAPGQPDTPPNGM